jgi:leader peptidase (prepilin peptidase)/N-methyltransferase
LIPIFSYIWLRGHCRYCRASVPIRILLIEISTGIIFALLYWYSGISAELGILILYTSMFIVIFFTDLEHGLILNVVTYPGIIIALIFSVFLPQTWLVEYGPNYGIANAALGGVIGFVIFFLLAVIRRGGMGWGDVKLTALIGFAVGYPLVLLAILIGALLGGVAAIILLASGKRRRGQSIQYGPFLAIAAMIALLWGTDMVNWYKGLL